MFLFGGIVTFAVIPLVLLWLPIPRWVGFDPAWLNQAARYFPLVGVVVALIAGALHAALAQAVITLSRRHG